MARGFSIKAKGIDRVQAFLASGAEAIKKEVSGVFENTAKEFVQRAKRDAPKDTGFLAGEITYHKNAQLSFSISSQSLYAGYLEFGTGKNYRAIPGFEDIAAQLKGKGIGSYKDGLDNIKQWVKRKGITFQSKGGKALTPDQTAYIIFHFILRNGIRPHPYFFKQVPIAEVNIERDLNAINID